MWCRRDAYESLIAELAEQRTKREVAERELALRQQTIEWMRVQINTIQHERTALLARVTGAALAVPTLRPVDGSPLTATAAASTVPTDQFFNKLSSLFEDPGDEAAVAMGATHDEAGAVVYTQ